MATEIEIKNAVAAGAGQYWVDSRLQEDAYNKWAAGGFQGECPQMSKGAITDYITRAVLAVTHEQSAPAVMPGIAEKVEDYGQ